MSNTIQAIRGMHDILPSESYIWRHLEVTMAAWMASYGYEEIRFPIVEYTSLFKRSIGEVTDIVEKEMYTFFDRNEESLTLRPEGTAGCVRACIEQGLLHRQTPKLWYRGPMFRYEKPQKGRYRQFHQMGVEVFGIEGVAIELELLAMTHRLWQILGLDHVVQLQINTLGTIAERQQYRDVLVHYLRQHHALLDEDSQRRLQKNPLRIFDSKNPDVQRVVADAPQLIDVLQPASRQHFTNLCQGLEFLGISYTINPLLVRGLDYYEHTVFEWVTDKLGSQATICAGGRYDKLVEQLGGPATPAAGFAIGLERLLLLHTEQTQNRVTPLQPELYVIAMGEEAMLQALRLAEEIRANSARCWRVEVNTSGGSYKSQFKKADKSGARLALILGEDEMQTQRISVKDLRQMSEQKTILQTELCTYLQSEWRE